MVPSFSSWSMTEACRFHDYKKLSHSSLERYFIFSANKNVSICVRSACTCVPFRDLFMFIFTFCFTRMYITEKVGLRRNDLHVTKLVMAKFVHWAHCCAIVLVFNYADGTPTAEWDWSRHISFLHRHCCFREWQFRKMKQRPELYKRNWLGKESLKILFA